MSAKRPSRRYIGFRYEPLHATRKEVNAALDGAWRAAAAEPSAAAPRLLVCQRGVGILVVPTARAAQARLALEWEAREGAVHMSPVVSSGTIAAIKRKMRVAKALRARSE